MAGYRNRLVHLYSEVTDEELYNILIKDLKDIRNVIIQIRNYIARIDFTP